MHSLVKRQPHRAHKRISTPSSAGMWTHSIKFGNNTLYHMIFLHCMLLAVQVFQALATAGPVSEESRHNRTLTEHWNSPTCQEFYKTATSDRARQEWYIKAKALNLTHIMNPPQKVLESFAPGGRGRAVAGHPGPNEIVVSDKYKFVYVNVRKSASTSSMKVLKDVFGATWGLKGKSRADCPVKKGCQRYGWRCTSTCLDRQHLEGYFVFTFVRHPVERFYSSLKQVEEVRHSMMNLDLSNCDKYYSGLKSRLDEMSRGRVRNDHLETQAYSLSTTVSIDGLKGSLKYDWLGDATRFDEELPVLFALIEKHSGQRVPPPPAVQHSRPGGTVKEKVTKCRSTKTDALVAKTMKQDMACFGFQMSSRYPTADPKPQEDTSKLPVNAAEVDLRADSTSAPLHTRYFHESILFGATLIQASLIESYSSALTSMLASNSSKKFIYFDQGTAGFGNKLRGLGAAMALGIKHHRILIVGKVMREFMQVFEHPRFPVWTVADAEQLGIIAKGSTGKKPKECAVDFKSKKIIQAMGSGCKIVFTNWPSVPPSPDVVKVLSDMTGRNQKENHAWVLREIGSMIGWKQTEAFSKDVADVKASIGWAQYEIKISFHVRLFSDAKHRAVDPNKFCNQAGPCAMKLLQSITQGRSAIVFIATDNFKICSCMPNWFKGKGLNNITLTCAPDNDRFIQTSRGGSYNKLRMPMTDWYMLGEADYLITRNPPSTFAMSASGRRPVQELVPLMCM
eukprot:CAMPEP_0181332050 /NCGR_PEP_ID=MMETSP1101-20121128/24861_1 /TAXON_ID=46948 /ORGANISM="Rhodomonas abbreviata, Strain Caron Lab Isolate" /LENGTH=735 /DNA_ID=CAMNT_0023441617 /DNA_START=11 /DNA_END=2218 /DNA_ORIENTATION=+